MALDLPVLLIDEFGISADLINQGFVGSGCLGGLTALRAAEFRRPKEWWLADNYFHRTIDNTWLEKLAELVESAAAGQLPLIAEGLDPGRTRHRRRLDRLRLTSAGSALVRARHRVLKRLRRLK
jgi:hypothetical protein